MEKIGSKGEMRATLQFFSCIFGRFKNALTGQHGPARRCDISFLKALVMYFHWKKIQPARGLPS
jgi:hypothetical protein